MITNKIFLIKPFKLTYPFVVSPPLGLMYLASVLRNKGHQIKIVDMRLDRLKPEDVLKQFKDFQPDIVGFSTITPEANSMHRIVSLIKRENPLCKVIVGGPHASSYPQETLQDSNIDFLVIGEGEQTTPELIEAIEAGRDFTDIKGIAFRHNGQTIFTSPRAPITDLDSLPFPAWDLVEMEKYFRCNRFSFNNLTSRRPYMSIFTSRGCPYRCIYCHNIFGKGYRARSPENVLLEIETIKNKYNICEFEIIDDCFNLDLSRAKKICDLIIERKLNIKLSFPNGVRGDAMDEELIHKLKKAGTFLINYAIETASPRLQKLIKKDLNLMKVKQMISYTSQIGIFTHGACMLGFPTETKEEILETIKFATDTDLDSASFFIVTPFKGTELFAMARSLGKRVMIDFEDYYFNFNIFNLSKVDSKELFALQRKAYRVFHLNIKRIRRIFKTHTNKLALMMFLPIFLNRAFSKREKRSFKEV